MRIVTAIKAFFRILFDGEFRKRIEEPPQTEAQEWDPEGPAVLLSLFQREGRLIDFLREDIDGFQDAQVGAAARLVHKGCQKVITEYLDLSPICSEAEGDTATVVKGFDPSAIRLSGSVTGDPPFTGVLKHHGWRITRLDLPRRQKGHDKTVVQVAEVEIP